MLALAILIENRSEIFVVRTFQFCEVQYNNAYPWRSTIVFISFKYWDFYLFPFSELSPNPYIKQHISAQQNVQQNVRHKNIDFQFELTPWYICASFDPLPSKNSLGFLSLFTRAPPPSLWDYIIM